MTPIRPVLAAAAAALLLAPASSAAQTAAAPVEFTAAGIPVIFKPITANEVIAVRLYLRGGSALQTPETAGIDQLMVNLATHGTAKYSEDEFADLATATGTQIGGEVTHDYAVLSALAVRRHWEQAWDLFTEAAINPTYPEEELAQLRPQLLNALNQRRDNPDQLLAMLGDSVAYAGSAYAVDPMGTPASIAAITREELVRWHRLRMAKPNLVLVVVGNLSRAELEEKVERAFGTLPLETAALPAPTLPTPGGTPVVVVERELPTNYIAGMFRAPTLSDPDYPATRLALYLLSNRLFEEVRTRRNLTYAVQSSLMARGANLGRLYVTAVEPDTTLRVMLSEVRRLQEEPVTRQQLRETVSVLTTNYWAGQLSNMGQANQLGTFEMLGGGWENAIAFVDRLAAVTPQEVQSVARRYLRDGRFVVVGDPEKIDRALFSSW